MLPQISTGYYKTAPNRTLDELANVERSHKKTKYGILTNKLYIQSYAMHAACI